MPTTPDPLAGDVPNEPTPRTGWRRFTPWLAALLAVVVVVGWQVLSRNPSLEVEGTSWSSPATVSCDGVGVSLHGSTDENVTDGSALYAVAVRNTSQFPVKVSADSTADLRVSFTDVVEAGDAPGTFPPDTSASVSVPTGKSVYLVVSAASPAPKPATGTTTALEQVELHTTTLGTTTSQSFALPERVVLYGGSTPPAEYRCS
ncbi:hypothetical protein GCM10023221_21000 [Luteimicrobium xylanilyticum]|uniref:Uncharacterized protein n=1 Tax=Luteimicrobium xylanilyticum TaxID=1133546 RepID=A0A5P9Q6R7_9MICO|nr:hypothetical protein [Luteimicrobium xylanilyticum]QFU96966.1 hypothetical protein KDY119_00458 [Luteimicrobium xylanilyticum]